MDPARKRKIRLVVALSAAVLLAAGPRLHVLQRLDRGARALRGARLELGRHLRPHRQGGAGDDRAHRRATSTSRSPTATAPTRLPVTYTGTVPDPFRDGREVIVTGELEDGTFVAEHDSLITKCPSKFQDEAEQDPEHVIIDE